MLMSILGAVALATMAFAQGVTQCDLPIFVKCTNQLGSSLGFNSTSTPTLLPLNGADFVARIQQIIQETTSDGLVKLCGFAADFFECLGTQVAPCFQSDFLEQILGLTKESATIYRAFAAQTHIECSSILQGLPRFSCSGRIDGDHLNPSNLCGRAYYTCRGGLAYKAMCPRGETFRLITKSCAPITEAPRCQGMSTPEPEAPMFAPKFTCPEPDGIFPNGKLACSIFYYKCTYGKPTWTACEVGKFFDTVSLQCLDFFEILACQESTTLPTTILLDSTTTPYVSESYKIETTTLKDIPTTTTTVYVPYSKIETTTEKDIPTTTVYVPYSKFETTTEKDIPTTTVYVPYSKIETTTQKDIPSVKQYKRPYELNPYKSEYPTYTAPPTYDFDCSQQYDGDYPNPKETCSMIYYSCVGGMTSQRHCATGTRYSVESNMCDYPEYVVACGGHPTLPTISTTIQQDETLPPLLDCTNLKSANYEHPKEKCNSIYISCVGGKEFVRTCPAGLKFNIEGDYCDFPRWVPACGGVHTTTTTTIAPTTLPPAFDCSNKDDKNYPDPVNKCSHSFYSCVGGFAVAQFCFGSTKYDVEMDKCEYPNLIPDCGGHRTEAPISTTTEAMVDGAKFDCSKLEMGNHPEAKCSKWFFMCHGGQWGLKMACPEGTFFDLEMNECGYYDNIPDCSGKPRTTTVQMDVFSVTPAYPFECPSAGNFPDPKQTCSHYFISCDGAFGRAQLRNCSASLYYDKVTDMCMPFMETPACNSNPRPTDVTPKAIYQVTVTAPPQRNPKEFVCPSPDGFFAPLNGDKCPMFGWKCSYGVATRLPCPADYVFSKLSGKCKPAAEVKDCYSTPY